MIFKITRHRSTAFGRQFIEDAPVLYERSIGMLYELECKLLKWTKKKSFQR